MKKCFSCKPYMLLLFAFGLGAATITSALTMMEQLLASRDYTNVCKQD